MYGGISPGQLLHGRSSRDEPVVVPRGGISAVTLRPQRLALGCVSGSEAEELFRIVPKILDAALNVSNSVT